MLLTVGRPGRDDAIKSSRAVPGICTLTWRPFYRGWNEPRVLKDGRHPVRFVSQLPSDYVIGTHVGLQEDLAIVVFRDSAAT